MILALADKIVEDNALAEKFINKFRSRNRTDVEFVISRATRVSNSEKDFSDANFDMDAYFDDITKNTEKLSQKLFLGNPLKKQYLIFVYLYYGNLKNFSIPVKLHDEWYKKFIDINDKYDDTMELIGCAISLKTDWTEDIFASNTYARYIEKRKLELALHMGIDRSKLYEKMDILRYMPLPDYDHVYKMIVHSYVIDVFAKMYKELLIEFCKNFSFDKIANKSLRERYADMIREYENAAERQHDVLKKVRDENFRLKDLLTKKDFAESQKDICL